MKSEAPPQSALFEFVANLASLFGAPARLKLLLLIAQAPRSVEALAERTGESVANVSQHLKRLREGGLLRVEKEGNSRIYRLSDERVACVVEDLFDLAETQGVVFESLQREVSLDSERSSLSVPELKRELREERAILLDVRDAEESAATPVPGALAIALGDLEGRLGQLSRRKTYFLVCRGRACPRATEGVRLLRAQGFKAYRVKESPTSLRLNRNSWTKKEKESST